MNSFKPPRAIEKIASMLEKAGHSTWIVGGALRNHLLKVPIGDWDLATQATPEQILEIWPHAIDIGRAFGAMGLPTEAGMVQVTTLRVEALYRDHRRPHQVTFTKSIEEDLQRRDFTVNAMAYRIETGQWKDPFHGRQDILDKKLKSVGNAFDRMEEDALRILRAYRFMAQYDFTLDQELERAMTDSRDLLHHLPVERIMQEMHALLLAPHALQSLQSMQRVGLFSSILTSNIQSDVGFDRVAPSLILRMWYLMDLHKNLQVDQLNAWGLSKQQSKTLKQLEQLRLEPLAAKQKLWWLAWAKRLNIQHLASSLEVMDCAKIATWLRTFERQGHFELFQQFPVNGQALMKVLKLEPSKRVGEMLQALKEYYVERPDQLAGKSVETLIQNWYNASL